MEIATKLPKDKKSNMDGPKRILKIVDDYLYRINPY